MWPVAGPETFNVRQKRIRDLEWTFIERELKQRAPGRLLDVGCGTGYALAKAGQFGFEAFGIDPEVGRHGVVAHDGRRVAMAQSDAEALPFADNFFDVVYSSHALEHFHHPGEGLKEMRRVLKADGIALIAVPSGFMAAVSLVSQWLFTTHLRLGRFLIRDHTLRGLRHVALPHAHGAHAATVAQEIVAFSQRGWERLIQQYFVIQRVVYPVVYPYPDFPQFFPFFKAPRLASSFLFVCTRD